MQLGRFGIRDAKPSTTHLPSSSKLIQIEPSFCLFFYISIPKLPKPKPFYESDKEIFLKNTDIILTLTEKLIWLVDLTDWNVMLCEKAGREVKQVRTFAFYSTGNTTFPVQEKRWDK